VQYADYAFWQRELLGDPADPQSYAAELFGYWVPKLFDMPEDLALPYDFERPDALSSVGVQLPLCLDADLHLRLVELARETDTTLFMTVQAAVAVLLSRYGAGTDIPIGTVVAGRGEPEFEHMIGAFINTLVLRTDVSGRPAFRELLARVRATDLAAYEHQEVPFEYLAPALHPDREPSMEAPFRTLIAFDTGGLGQPRLDGVALEFHPVPANVARLDLIFHFVDQHDEDGAPAGVLGAIEYDTALFRPETAQELADGLVRILIAAVAAPETPVDELAPSLQGR
jgi:non-ribosomal peptide synthetase component F